MIKKLSETRPHLFFGEKLNKVLLVFVALFVTVASLLYLDSGKLAQESIYEQTYQKEKVIAKAGAKSLESFLELSTNSLLVLSARTPIIMQTPEVQEVLTDSILDWEDTPLVETILTDKDGKVLYVANRKGTNLEAGQSVADRGYFKWAQTAQKGDAYIGKVIYPKLGAFQGEYLTSIVTPVFKDGEFSGVLGAGVLLSSLTSNYLDPLKISDETLIFIINEDNTILYSPDKETIGQTTVLKEDGGSLGEDKFLKVLENGWASEEENLDVLLPDTRKETKKTYIAAYSDVKIGKGTDSHRVWRLIVATPEDDAQVYLERFRQDQTRALIVGIFIIFAMSCLYILVVRKAHREGYFEGFIEGRNHGGERTHSKPE